MAQADALGREDFAPEQVERLDAGRAFVDRGDARVACELLDAGLADVAVAAVNLDGVVGAFVRRFGQQRLDDRNQERQQFVGALALGFVGRALDDVDEGRGVIAQRARAFGERFLRQQHAANVGVHDERIGRLVGELRPAQRAAL